MVQGKTSSGFAYTVSEKLKNDFRFVLLYAKLKGKDREEQLPATVELVNLILGEDGAASLYAHVAEADGTVPTDRVMQELSEIIQTSGKDGSEEKN